MEESTSSCTRGHATHQSYALRRLEQRSANQVEAGTIALSMRTLNVHLTAVILCACVAACGSRPLVFGGIQLGRRLNVDHSVAEFTTVFAPHDTVYLSVLTTGRGPGTIEVRWMAGKSVIGEAKKQVGDVVATEFPLQSAGGFPPGEYSAEVFLDGKSVGTRTFKVQVGR
jgi:hypothetical protein